MEQGFERDSLKSSSAITYSVESEECYKTTGKDKLYYCTFYT